MLQRDSSFESFLKSTSIKREVEFHKAARETGEPRSLLRSYQIFMNCLMHLVGDKIKMLGGSLLNQTEEKWLSGETLQVLWEQSPVNFLSRILWYSLM